MASFNRVVLVGNLTRDPELRYTSSGTPVANFGLAVNERYKDSSGEYQDKPVFVDITAWSKLAETCNEYLGKGDPALIEGKLNYSTWEDNEGNKRHKLDVVMSRVVFLGSKKGQNSEEHGDADDIPF